MPREAVTSGDRITAENLYQQAILEERDSGL